VTASDGGFVQNSQVEVQRSGVSEASLLLRLPSAKLSGALASLGHLAPVRAESQSLQDITGAYDGARRRLADATAERTALLRALSKANTQVQITRLREQLSEVRGAISQARSSLEALSRRASTTEVAVTIYGTRHSASEGLTLHKGLRDVARVLLVVLVVLMIAAAVLVPVVALLAALITGRRWWRRYRRERVLNER
jgi:multidrug efflux pump subunit AcrA (membrane-fusion protein)